MGCYWLRDAEKWENTTKRIVRGLDILWHTDLFLALLRYLGYPALYRGPGEGMHVLLRNSHKGSARNFSQPRTSFFREFCSVSMFELLIWRCIQICREIHMWARLRESHAHQGASHGNLALHMYLYMKEVNPLPHEWCFFDIQEKFIVFIRLSYALRCVHCASRFQV